MQSRRPLVLIALATASLLTQFVRAQTAAAPADAGAYVGSAACQRCHEPEQESWRNTLHVQMTKPVAAARIAGDFRPGTKLQQNGRAYTMETHDGRYFISVARGSHPAETFEVNYTLGARRFQGYLSTLPDGRIYVLPVFWHNETKRWIDWKEITPVPDDPDHDLRQIWNVTCVNCHATNIVKNFNPSTNTYATTWTEMGVGCEACHGPGRGHVALMTEWERNPAARTANADIKIFSTTRATPRQVFDSCGYCHGNKNNVFFGFRPGDRYEDFALPFLISQPIPENDPQGDFWPDGRPSRFDRPQALTMTGCFRKGEATCTSCHKVHGASNDHALKVPVDAPGGGHTRESDTLCTQCHSDGAGRAGRAGGAGAAGGSARAGEAGRGDGAGGSRAALIPDLSAHTHHAADSPGSRCVECHMSDVNWRLITRRRDHTFQPPVPEMTARFGVPNACTTCHEDKSPEWAASTMDRWYGNRDRRLAIVAMADTIYRAGAGDRRVLPEVVNLALDRSHGALMRASAAEFAGQLIGNAARAGGAGAAGGSQVAQGFSPAIVNGLIGASADPEAMVRITAVRALALTGDARAAPVLAAHLSDPSRLVRVSVAEGLMALGVSKLDGERGTALANAQEEWAVSLRTFNDVAADQTTLGWLDAVRGNTELAKAELRAAIALDATDAKPSVYLGILYARAGENAEALRYLSNAKKSDPSYQNLDRMIEEVRKKLNPP
jgi:predicted CXXCH cytochrome family protein